MSENPNDRYPKVGTPVSTGVVWATLEPNRAYSPFAVYAWLEHRGDFERAARMLRQEGFGGEPIAVSTIRIVESTTISIDSNPIYSPVDPGPVPLEMLRIPGFVSEVMDLCLDTAPYPNHVMAFCGALTDSYLVFQAATSGDYFIGVSGEASDSSGGYWAPNGVKDQHSHETLLSLIEDLRKLAASQEERSEYVEVLKKHAAVVAGRR